MKFAGGASASPANAFFPIKTPAQVCRPKIAHRPPFSAGKLNEFARTS
jgi:hypothetical protein